METSIWDIWEINYHTIEYVTFPSCLCVFRIVRIVVNSRFCVILTFVPLFQACGKQLRGDGLPLLKGVNIPTVWSARVIALLPVISTYKPRNV